MALAPKFAGQAFSSSKISPKAVHTLELYLDYVCPFSAKLFNTLYSSILPSLPDRYPNLRLIFRQQIQPWHPSSTLCHEAGAAVLRLDPENFWPFSAELFKAQTEFFDENVVRETRNETYGRLAKVAGKVGVNESDILKLLQVSDKPAEDGSLNVGNGVTDDVKFLVKASTNRLTSVHGAVEGSISSSFTAEQWEEWLGQNVK
ncbi:hypothetical protein MMC07_007582 [Pseudocyphellaria aurata]|nr:hypothetical protein [Pseudocyphellaria aurata]